MWSFLANLGSGLKGLGSGFARGSRRLGEGDNDLGPGGTPPFIPDGRNPSYAGEMQDIGSGSPARVIENAVAGAENAARADFGAKPMPDLPSSRRDLPIPALTPPPSSAEMRSGLPSLPAPRRITPAASSAMPPAVATAEAFAPQMDLDRRNVPIPRLPGHSGGAIPYNTTDAAKYDSVMKHAKRDAEGNLAGGFNRDWRTPLRNAFLGAASAAAGARPGEDPLGRAIGGALTAGVGSVIDPQAGYEFAFDVGERPKLEAELQREQAAKERANLEILNRAKLEGVLADTDLKRAQGAKSREDIKLGRQAEGRQQALAASTIALNQAEIEAKRTGQAKLTMLFNSATGQFEETWVYPDGSKKVAGLSGEPELKLRDIRSREKIAREGEAAATGRTGMTIKSAKDLKQMDIDAERKMAEDFGGGDRSGIQKSSDGVTPEQINQIISEAKKRGQTVTEEQVRARLKARGQ